MTVSEGDERGIGEAAGAAYQGSRPTEFTACSAVSQVRLPRAGIGCWGFSQGPSGVQIVEEVVEFGFDEGCRSI